MHAVTCLHFLVFQSPLCGSPMRICICIFTYIFIFCMKIALYHKEHLILMLLGLTDFNDHNSLYLVSNGRTLLFLMAE